jgi:kinetochore protein Nuf2
MNAFTSINHCAPLYAFIAKVTLLPIPSISPFPQNMATLSSHQIHPPPLGGENQFGFPIETDDVILQTLAKIGINDIKEHDVQKPTQQIALTCFSAFLELLSYVNDEVIDTLKGDCLDRLEHRELYDESLRFVIRFREIRAMMIASCVPDFNVTDITRPKPKRFKKQIFALINFLRFSEHHIQHFDKLKEDNDHIFRERDELSAKLTNVEEKVKEEEDLRQSQEERTIELRDMNANLSETLRNLKNEQSSLLNELDDAKQDKNVAHAKLLKLIETSRLLNEEIERFTLRIENTPKELRAMIEKQKRQLKEKRSAYAEEETKAQNMHEKKRVLEALESDIATCTQLVKACLEEKTKLIRERQELDNVHHDMQDISKERDNLNMRIEQLQEKLRWAMERLERTQKNIETKREENKRKMENGAEEWEGVQAEKKRRSDAVDQLNKQLAGLEDEYAQITSEFDNFYSDLLQQKQKLETQCLGYMRAMGKKMDLQVDL